MALRRANSLPKLALLLALAFSAAGCANLGMYYKKADQEGPLANLNGVWANEDLTMLLAIQQTGSTARGSFNSIGTASASFAYTGEIKGRVLIGGVEPPESETPINGLPFWYVGITMTANVDGKAGSLAIVGIRGDPHTILDPTTLHRLAGLPAAPPTEPWLKGALGCRLPFDGAGRFQTDGAAGTLRDAYVSLTYRRSADGQVQPVRMVVPAEAPRLAASLRSSGEGIFGKAIDTNLVLSARSGLPSTARQTSTIDDKTLWWVLSPLWDEGSTDSAPSAIIAELYTRNPDPRALPDDAIEIARRTPGGAWSSTGGYISCTSGLYRATARLENGAPAGVQIAEVAEPPLEDFLAAKEYTVATARWRSGALLLVKSRTLPKLLRDGKTGDLSRLVERLEKLVLDLNHEGEVAKDRAQRAVETQSGDAEQLREMALAYKERIEVLKPILAALKEELANRAK